MRTDPLNWLGERSFLKATRTALARLAERVRMTVRAQKKLRKGILPALILLSVALVGVISGIWLQSKDLPSRALSHVRQLVQTAPQTQVVTWRDVTTHLHIIQVGTAQISSVTIYGGSLAEAGGNILIASPQGQL